MIDDPIFLRGVGGKKELFKGHFEGASYTQEFMAIEFFDRAFFFPNCTQNNVYSCFIST